MTPCVEFQGYRDRGGYGTKWRDGRMHGAHRLAYADHYGPIPEGMTVDHLCFNRACIAPSHLRLLTYDENRARQRRALQPHCKWGHEFTPENTIDRSGKPGQGRRECRQCQNEASRRYRARRALRAAGVPA